MRIVPGINPQRTKVFVRLSVKFIMAKSSILALVLCALAVVSAVPCAPKAPAAPSAQSAPAHAVAAPPPDQRQESAHDAINAEQVCEIRRQQDQLLQVGKRRSRAEPSALTRAGHSCDSTIAHLPLPSRTGVRNSIVFRRTVSRNIVLKVLRIMAADP
jgi:hypothetical protein